MANQCRVLVVLLVLSLLAARMPAPAAAEDATWRGEYYNNQYLSGAPVYVSQDGQINYDWGEGTPAPGVAADHFSVRWTRSVSFSGGTYRFQTQTDDGTRLWVDNTMLVDQWHDMYNGVYAADVSLSAGDHFLRMEYYESTGTAQAHLSWTNLGGSSAPPPAPPTADAPPDSWWGEYFNNPSLSGSPVVTRWDPAVISFDWGGGSPDPAIPADNFSVRWTRTFNLGASNYQFSTQTDDGVRLWVDGQLIIDKWGAAGYQTASSTIQLASGGHNIRMEYFESSGGAVARLSIAALNIASVGNLVTYCPPYGSNSWVKVYQWANNTWVDRNPGGYAPMGQDGRIKIDGLPVDYGSYGADGHPYKVELYIQGSLAESTGDFTAGQPYFRIKAGQDNYTPWGQEVLAF
jgi:hypothetical protein